MQVGKEEIVKLVSGFDNQDILTGSGVTLAGQRYIYLSGTDRVVRAKFGKIGVHCMKTQQGGWFGWMVGWCHIFEPMTDDIDRKEIDTSPPTEWLG